jgi:hypothetical protein
MDEINISENILEYLAMNKDVLCGTCDAAKFEAFRKILHDLGNELAQEQTKIDIEWKVSVLDATLNMLNNILQERPCIWLQNPSEFNLFNLKKDLIRVIANLTYHDVSIRDRVSDKSVETIIF